jgi:hypothetical protein
VEANITPPHFGTALMLKRGLGLALGENGIGRGTGQLTRTMLPKANAYAMIRRRAAAAGIATKLGNR